ncbi:helix-turn-helix domain-containing protein [Alteromonas sp. a30]|uniref:helix-turn-helix domain-containing protein n=1 Tax=Alteromonas sp. a30 TaxID=2730917 RepID=UPI00227FAD97|nr:helix-turn-helix domain-containing protein [Alteromonas sp. a30]MCY7295025.1 helix-turn-helix domain-containing protein [Alteromonas sp. a30]
MIFESHKVDMEAALSHRWVGNSPALTQLKQQISKYAGVDFPLILRGEKGTGKSLAASSIHEMSARRTSPFINVCCSHWDPKSAIQLFEQCFKKALGGSILLKNLNVLPESILNRLQPFWEREYMGQVVPVRIMCTFWDRHENKEVIESCAPWLSLSLPNLNRRTEDIPLLIHMLREKYKNIKHIEFEQDCWPLIFSNSWEDNVKGLERFFAKLAVLSEDEVVSKKALIYYFPEFEGLKIDPAYLAMDTFDENKPKLGSKQSIAVSLLENQIPDVAHQHIAISRSLNFMMQQFNEKITIEHAAKKACVSPPHLSFLYRKHLGVSFKKLLLELRIEYSKRLLRNQPSMQITQISYETGFHDLSHFEKTFRKLVGIKPSQYRRQLH